MPKTTSANLRAHIEGGHTTMAVLTRITRRDGAVYAFTDHDRDIEFGGLTYSRLNSFDRSQFSSAAGLSVTNIELAALIDSEAIAEADLLAGLFDFAGVLIQEVNYEALEDGAVDFHYGTIGEISLEGRIFRGDMRGLAQRLAQTIGRLYGRRCDWNLGDANCQVDLGPLTQSGTVATAADRASFTASGLSGADNLFNHGLVTWTSGANTAFPMEVKRWISASSTIELFMPVPRTIAPGDGFDVYPGCDKNFSTCRDVFSNGPRHGGFPLMPTRDQVMRYPDSPT